MAKLYPLHVELKIHITNGDRTGTVTFSYPVSQLPAEDKMPEILEKVSKVLPDDFRIMTRHESFIYYLREEKGYRGPNNLAMPEIKSGDEWHDPQTENVYMPSDEHLFEEEDY